MTRRTALVTGAARGIGRGVALGLAGAGFDVVAHYKESGADAAETVRLCRTLGVQATHMQADVTDPEQAARLVQAAHAAFAGVGLGVLVNNVGNYVHRPLEQLSVDEWREMFASNLDATFYTCRAALPLFRAAGYGRVVNLGYAGAQHLLARPGIVAYAIAKSGVIALTAAIARETAGSGISANVVSPGVIETSVAQPTREIPAGRVGTVGEVVGEVLHFVLASDYVTGQVVEVAGGWNL